MLKEYQTVKEVFGPIVFIEDVPNAAYNETVMITLPSGEKRKGQVLESSAGLAAVQVFGPTTGFDTLKTSVSFSGETLKLPVSDDMLGRVFDGAGEPIDRGAPLVSKTRLDINGSAINPYARAEPHDFIQTGISTIDALNTLVRGQKLPIFSTAGLPHNELAVQIARQAAVRGSGEEFVVVFAAMGITYAEASFFMKDFEKTGALERAVLFLNLANDPSIERLITPRMALTTAEYLAYEKDMQVLVVLTDMTNYCDALREIAAARQEVPGRRGYPGYMYSVDGSRRVVIKDSQGNLQNIRFTDLFQKLTSSGYEVVKSSDGVVERILTPGWEALSADQQGKSEFKPLKQVLRHRYDGQLLKITSQAGETIVTPNHSVFTVVGGLVVPALSQELKVGDLLAHVNKLPIPSMPNTLSAPLASLAGYYVSEGHALKYLDKEKNAWCHYVRIDNNDEDFVEDVRQKFNEVFSKYPSTFVSDKRSGTTRCSLGGLLYYNTLVNTLGCGTNSHTKRVPSQIFTAPLNVQESFLEAYYWGDGKAQDPRYKTRQYDMVTVSDGLRDDLMMLSKSMFPNRIPTFYKWNGRDAWKVYLSTSLKGKSERVNDVVGAEIKKIEWVEPTEAYVYDLSVPGNQNFVDACGGVLLHNTDLASLYERAGTVKGKKGTVTQLPILTMPEEDITHPIPDLTGYITEGQIVLSRELHRKNIYPNVDVLPSLSRLMNLGIGPKRTREDHAGVSSQLYASYAQGRDLRQLVAVVGEEALSEKDKKFLGFANHFEERFVQQGKYENRAIEQSLDLAWDLLSVVPEGEMKRVKSEHLEKYGRKFRK